MEREGVGLMEAQNIKPEDKKPTWWDKNSISVLAISLFVFVMGAWLACMFILVGASDPNIPYESSDIFKIIGNRGTFGDMFGSVNALFSGLAFAGLFLTLFIQIKEFRLQREELKLTREAMADQKQVMEGQTVVMDQQRKQIDIQNFESAFFQILKMHYEVLEELNIRVNKDREVKGWKTFIKYEMDIKKSYEHYPKIVGEREDSSKLHYVIRDHHRGSKHPFPGYVRSLISLCGYVSRSKVEDVSEYIELLKSRMGTEEKVFLAYEVYSERNQELLEWVARYRLLDGLTNSNFPIQGYYDEVIQYLLSPCANDNDIDEDWLEDNS